VYLTFDDGPHPEITREAMAILKRHGVKATFFCVGSNVSNHPDVIRELLASGHRLANHTHNHCSGWQTPNRAYFRSFLDAQSQLPKGVTQFRPPYGRITRSQAECIGKRSEIVMWDVLSRDWDTKLTWSACLDTLKRHTAPGSIVVFHDSVKAAPRMLTCLSEYLTWLDTRGYSIQLLPERENNQPSLLAD
jgi:peptidoglycan/xylan/chitin deacetylase (PgdA/CDA1 family)